MLTFLNRNFLLSTLWLYWAGALIVYLLYNQHTYLFVVPYLLIAIFAIEIFIVFKKKNAPSTQQSNTISDNATMNTANNNTTHTSKPQTIIALGTLFNGDIKVEGDIQIYGQVTGNIHVKDGTIRVMRSGHVQGDLHSPTIIVDGNIEGICVTDSLEILENGRLKGIVRGNNLSIKKGGIFIGQSEINDKPEQPAQLPTVEKKAESENAIAEKGSPKSAETTEKKALAKV